MATQEKVDVAIVGAGASGSVFAAVLGKGGKKGGVPGAGPAWGGCRLRRPQFWGRGRQGGEPYPMPPMKPFRNGEVWLKGFEAVGIRMVPAAVGMNSTDYKGRPACIYDGWCHIGCPTGALSNPLVTYLADARKAGAEVRARSTVTRVLTNRQGTRASAVEYYDAKKERRVQEASVVVLAAWSAQNPRLLLNSATDRHPRGLANASGLVGKYMMCHYSSGTWALFDEDVQNHLGTTGAQFMSYDRYGKTAHPGVFGSSFIVAGSALKTSDLGGVGDAP